MIDDKKTDNQEVLVEEHSDAELERAAEPSCTNNAAPSKSDTPASC